VEEEDCEEDDTSTVQVVVQTVVQYQTVTLPAVTVTETVMAPCSYASAPATVEAPVDTATTAPCTAEAQATPVVDNNSVVYSTTTAEPEATPSTVYPTQYASVTTMYAEVQTANILSSAFGPREGSVASLLLSLAALLW